MGAGGAGAFRMQLNKTRTVRVENAPEGAEAGAISDHLSQYGKVDQCKSAEGEAGGFLLQFESREAAEKAIIQGKQFDNATLRMQWAPNLAE